MLAEKLFETVYNRYNYYFPNLSNTEITNRFISFVKDSVLLYDLVPECIDCISKNKSTEFFEDWEMYVLKRAITEKIGSHGER